MPTATRLEIADDIALLELNRPEQLNAMTDVMREELESAYASLSADDNVRVVILTGAGRGFCAGADVGPSFGTRRPEDSWQEMLDEFRGPGRRSMALYRLAKPTIAAVNGVAAGAGFSMALACDVRIGSDRARFKNVFVERNMPPDTGLSYFLPRAVGSGAAMEIALTARFIEAEEAKALGIVQRVVPHADLIQEARAMARVIADHPPLAIQMTKRALQRSWDHEYEDQLRYEMRALELARKARGDTKEAATAFRERRTPRYTGH